ncbi:MAG: methyltransferase domain-containing protein [Acetobacteraceae bacterium]|nr:methyltransferase domain-containing protein [Acetobacteraceae bacterium]
MRETFPREAASSPEPFTGERLTASIHGQVEIEHYHRYLFARGLCRDRDVLDVASGEGYGAAQLAQVARRVVGVECAGATARNAAVNFPRDNLHFIQADARSLPLCDASVDVVTSFETIEHFDRQEDFVAEVHRVIRPNGSFVVSTPDRDIYSPPGTPPNPFHVQEFDRTEFLDLLYRHFKYVSLIRQRPILASALIPEEPASVSPIIFERTDDLVFSSDIVLPRAPYLIAIASDLAPMVAPISLLVERSDIDNVRFADRIADLERQHEWEAAELERMRVSGAEELEQLRVSAAEEQERLRISEATAREAAERFEREAESVKVTLAHTRAVLAQASTDLDRVSGSARHFIVQYIPRLWRYFVRS